MKKYSLYIVVALFVACFLFVFPKTPSQQDVVIPGNDFNYSAALSETYPDIEIESYKYPSTTRDFADGETVAIYETQAMPLISEHHEYTFYPHVTETVVIAVDRDKTDEEIESFEDLLHTSLAVNFDFGREVADKAWEYPKTHQIVISMANALYGSYDINAVARDFKMIDEQSRFYTDDMSQPIIVTHDSVAVNMLKSGRNIEIIIPSEGTLSFNYGVLAHSGNTDITEDAMENEDIYNNLLQHGYRLIDGRADENYYPTAEQYESTSFTEDFTKYNATTADVSRVLRRVGFNSRTFGFTNPKEMTVAYFVLLFFLIVYLLSIMRRITDKIIGSALINACVLLIVLITLGLLKLLSTSDPVLETILWYSYYIPILLLPAIFVYIGINSGHVPKRALVNKIYNIYFALNLILLITVMTNNYHGFIFTVHDHLNTAHDYNIGYYIMAVWIFLSVLFAISLLIYKNFKSPKKRAFGLPVIVSIIAIIYTVGYVLEVQVVRELDITFSISLIAVMYIESCMQSRLFPNNKKYKKLFENSDLSMEIRDNSMEVLAKSSVSRTADENFVLCKTPIAGGVFSYYEDYSSLNTAREKLAKVNAELQWNNEFLMQTGEINANLAALAAEKSAYEKIDEVLNSGTKKIALLIDELSQGQPTKSIMVRINIIACTLKRECIMLINALHMKEQSVEMLLNSVAEMKEFTLPINLKITTGFRQSENLQTEKAILVYRFFSEAVLRAAEIGCSDLLVQLYDSGDDTFFSILADKVLYNNQDISELSENLTTGDCKLSAKEWDDTEIYLLSFKRRDL